MGINYYNINYFCSQLICAPIWSSLHMNNYILLWKEEM